MHGNVREWCRDLKEPYLNNLVIDLRIFWFRQKENRKPEFHISGGFGTTWSVT